MDTTGLSSWVGDICRKLRMVKPFPIQSAVIRPILAGNDVIGCAPTGQGKTAAFGLPLVQRFSEDPQMFFGLAVAPTRELAKQLNDQLLAFGEPAGLRTSLVVGGTDLTRQKDALIEGVHVLVGTPGRLAEMALDQTIGRRFKRIRMAIFDECDRLVTSPMDEDVQTVRLPPVVHLCKNRHVYLYQPFKRVYIYSCMLKLSNEFLFKFVCFVLFVLEYVFGFMRIFVRISICVLFRFLTV